MASGTAAQAAAAAPSGAHHGTTRPQHPPSGQADPLQPSTSQPEQAQAASKPRRRRRQPQARAKATSERDEPIAETDEEDDNRDAEPQGPGQGHAPMDTDAEPSEFGDADTAGATSDMEQFEPDPLYDPEADDEDERLLQEQRQGRTSDAILSCPGCFTTVCIDCQQHSQYKNQYRAMFVMNCVADVDTWVAPKSHGASTSGKKRSQRPGEEPSAGQDTPASGSAEPAEGACHPVMCEVCETQVGVVDPVEGMYILYNIVPSEA